SVLVPTLVSRPGHVPAGVVNDDLLSHYDVFPTLLTYTGLPVPDAGQLPGRSFAGLLRGEGEPTPAGRDFVVAGGPHAGSPGRPVHDEYGPVRRVRTREWKSVHRHPYGPHELYDLTADPEERTNLVDDPARRAVREELKAELDAWFVRYADPARDGVREGVTGSGQLDLAGPAGRGVRAFA